MQDAFHFKRSCIQVNKLYEVLESHLSICNIIEENVNRATERTYWNCLYEYTEQTYWILFLKHEKFTLLNLTAARLFHTITQFMLY
jgi:hypothetical protein